MKNINFYKATPADSRERWGRLGLLIWFNNSLLAQVNLSVLCYNKFIVGHEKIKTFTKQPLLTVLRSGVGWGF